jgi:hypothetical protein
MEFAFLGEQFDLGPASRQYSAIWLNIVNTAVTNTR